jgi:hypothetical protein
MNNDKQNWLTNYLINCNFNVSDCVDLQNKLTGMTAQQIIEAMEKAHKIISSLNSTSLGRELN